ncbi:MAG: PKD domain-containing protein, partial [Candidatus Cloacimonetes bacterium]|nr:PKD domain-containing protein [Candidatus Cloacimonadota bacterium]
MFPKILALLIIMITGNLIAQNLLSGPESVAYDHQNNRYLVSNYYNGRIIEVDSLGGQSIFRQGLGRCLGNHIHGGILWVSVRDYWQVSSGRAVLGLDLATGETVHTIEFYATTTVDGLAADNDGFIYVVDTTGRIYKIDVAAGAFELLTNIGLGQNPQDIFHDAENNRLITVNYSGSGSFISAVDLESGGTTLLLDPDFGDLDGVCLDQYGNIYVSSWNDGGVVYRIDDSFAYDPEVISSGNNGPAGLDYDPYHNRLIIPNFNANTLSIIDLEFTLVADFSASQTVGCTPLTVQFNDCTLGSPLVWWWDFNNDGVTDAFSADPVWIYDSPGVYTVALKVHDGSDEDQEI